MKASAAVVVERRRERSRCTTLRSAPPLTFRVTPEGLHLVGTAAGPVGGDELDLALTVAAGAALTVRSVAAQLVFPAAQPAPSTLRLTVDVGPGAALRWLPEPTVAVRGADHRATTDIRLGAGADLVWRDEVVLGRDGEPGGSVLQRIRVERAGAPLLCTEVALGPAWPTSSGPAATGGARVVAATLLVGRPARSVLAAGAGGHDEPAPVAEVAVRSASHRLTDDAVLLTALGARLDAVRSAIRLLGAPTS